MPDGAASWHVGVSKYIDSPLLSAAQPVWDPSHESIVAVVGVTTALYSVGQLMKELVEVHSGHIYLTSQEGYLLATSTNAPLLRNSTMGPELMMAVDSEDRVIRMGAEWLQEAYNNKFPPNHVVHVENAILDHKQYYIDSFFLNLKRLPIVSFLLQLSDTAARCSQIMNLIITFHFPAKRHPSLFMVESDKFNRPKCHIFQFSSLLTCIVKN